MFVTAQLTCLQSSSTTVNVVFMAARSNSSEGLDLSIRVGPNTMATLRSTIYKERRGEQYALGVCICLVLSFM